MPIGIRRTASAPGSLAFSAATARSHTFCATRNTSASGPTSPEGFRQIRTWLLGLRPAPPPVVDLPQRPPLFIGHEPEIETLRTRLEEESSVAYISGLAGRGKTTSGGTFEGERGTQSLRGFFHNNLIQFLIANPLIPAFLDSPRISPADSHLPARYSQSGDSHDLLGRGEN